MVGVIGSGVEARSNLAAMIAVRPIAEVRVYSPREARREAFAEEVRAKYAIAAIAVDRPDAAVREADIAIVATNTLKARDPIAFRAEWMEPGMHVSSIGATMKTLRELSEDCFSRPDLVVVDAASEQMQEECDDVIAALHSGTYGDPVAMAAVVAGSAPGRRASTDITLFKSVGTAMQDILAALAVYDSARAAKAGESFELLHLKEFETPMNLVQATQMNRP